jgi:hypothetical protein
MSLEPGQSHKGDAQHTETRTAAESLSSGDAVALDANGELVKAVTDNDDTTTTDDPVVYGVVGYYPDGIAAGDEVLVTYSGPVVANVAAGVGPGVELGSSTTEGQLAAGTSAKGIMTMYAEGAAPGGIPDIPDGYAHVDV